MATARENTQFDNPPRIGPSSYVTLHYRISVFDGAGEERVVIDTFSARPATLQMGIGQWAPGLEAPLIGHAEGERFSYVLAPAEAYGERNPDLVRTLTREAFEEHAVPGQLFEPGDTVEFAAPNGERYAGMLKELAPDHAVLDFNHPLAGNKVKVEVAILGVL